MGRVRADQLPGEGGKGQQADDHRGRAEFQLEYIHQDVGRRHHVVQHVGGDLRKGDKQQGAHQQRRVVHGVGKDLNGVGNTGGLGHHIADQAHEQGARQNRHRVNGGQQPRAGALLVLARVVTDVENHGAVDAEEQHGCAPERQPPGTLHGQQAHRQLITVALHRAVEHVHQRGQDKGAADVLQPLDALKAHHRQANLQKLEGDEEEHQVVEPEQRGRDHVQRAGANPALKAVPDNGWYRAYQARQAGAGKAEGAARLHHEGNAVFVAGGAIEDQRNADHKTADGDGQGGLNQVQGANHAGAHGEGADGDTAAKPGQQVGEAAHDADLLRGQGLVPGGLAALCRQLAGRCAADISAHTDPS